MFALAKRLGSKWATRRYEDALFLLLVLLLAGGTVFALANGGSDLERQAHSAGTTPSPGTRLVIGQARVIVDHVASGDAGLMQPAVDQRGNIWVGEMYANRFARFDSQSEAVTTWVAPHGNDGIMDTTVDVQGHPWFVEQDANYIARFDPATGTFHIFPLGKVGGRPLGPQDLQFDQKGMLWFTASIAGRIGRLDPATGKFQTWSIPAPAPGLTASPYSLAVTPGGRSGLACSQAVPSVISTPLPARLHSITWQTRRRKSSRWPATGTDGSGSPKWCRASSACSTPRPKR
jgi:hypothetical protein